MVYIERAWLTYSAQLVDKHLLPRSECLKDTIARALPFWFDVIVPDILVSRISVATCAASSRVPRGVSRAAQCTTGAAL